MRKQEAQGVETGNHPGVGTKFGEGQSLSTSLAMISAQKILAQSTGLAGMPYT